MAQSVNDTLSIGFLHYHLLQSGVRTVVSNAVKSLICFGPWRRLHIDLISSDAQQETGRSLAAKINQWATDRTSCQTTLGQIEIAALAYNDGASSSRERLFSEAEGICQSILSSLDLSGLSNHYPYILHVHNGNLGKNPRVTLALKLLADRIDAEDLPIRIFYQVHDFAEDQRPDNYHALLNCSGQADPLLAVEMMYPPNSCIRWLCINSADKEKIESVGLDPDRITVLPNAVDIETFSTPSLLDETSGPLQQSNLKPADFAEDLRGRIADFAQKNGTRFDPDRQILLSPIKLIRRKNVSESVLLLLLLNHHQDHWQLLVTLNPNSPADIEYAGRIETFIKENHLPVVLGFGHELAGHQPRMNAGGVEAYGLIELMALSDAVVTTSIQEGFGYVFHEPWLAGKVVVGRNIASVTNDFRRQGMRLDHLYDHLLIPLSWLEGKWQGLAETYCQKITHLRQQAGLSPLDPAELKIAIEREKLLRPPASVEEMIDWADLDINTQLAVLRELTKAPHRIDLIRLTDSQLEPISLWPKGAQSDIIAHNQNIVANSYSLKAVAQRLSSLITGATQSANKASGPLKRGDNKPIFDVTLACKAVRLII